ncbi:MAG: hypothetical protein IPN90_11530 [Elusimicrobia bacterium]|nr:hypothetical protein [Elusimicrobiota bacterium]
MRIIEEFFLEIDRRWKQDVTLKIPLKIVGSGALLLQVDYDRGTKDSDVLETAEITPFVKNKLLELAGKGSTLCKSHRMYLDIVASGIPFLPPDAVYHKMVKLNDRLKHFEIETLDILDVVVSKLKRFNANDVSDISAMVAKGLVKHTALVGRFRKAVEGFLMDARAIDLPTYVSHLHTVERDFFRAPASEIELPDWL